MRKYLAARHAATETLSYLSNGVVDNGVGVVCGARAESTAGAAIPDVSSLLAFHRAHATGAKGSSKDVV